ncbi:unnamed protein product [Cyclocybe aegerita]|uniref:Transmembrane protein n=1 Tax=Cyclocybe aegerita TaxID=1973307 RepID=A0A8S0W4F8_CYCAE|nr:unnamed protein product [Cyclocybe aegerita]
MLTVPTDLSMATDIPQLPNPTTPLAWLPPSLASQFEVSRYLLVATCGMFSWDILINMRNDWNLLRKHNIRLPTLVYFFSRIAAFAYIITGTVFTIGAVGDCQALQVAIGCCYAAAVPATSLLFFFRIKAIFNNNVYVVGLFGFLWIATLAGSITVPFAIEGIHIGLTDHCINSGVKPFSSAGVIIATVNDTLVFMFISWRLLMDTTYEDTWRARVASFFRGKGLPAFSQSLLQSGQEYYLVTVGGNILTMGMILAPDSLPPVFHAMFTVPNMAINNAMACRVYRDIKFGRISSTSTTVRTLPTFVAKRGDAGSGATNRKHRDLDTFELSVAAGTQFDETATQENGIRITKAVQQFRGSEDPLKISLADSNSGDTTIHAHSRKYKS